MCTSSSAKSPCLSLPTMTRTFRTSTMCHWAIMRNHGCLHDLQWRSCGHVLRLLDVDERRLIGPDVSLDHGLSVPIPDHEWFGAVVSFLLKGGYRDAHHHDQ